MRKGEEKRKCERGFTFLEVLIVLAISVLLAILTFPIGLRFFQSQLLDEAVSGIENALRRAGAQSFSQKNDSAFGVKFLSGSYTLFQGNSYATRVVNEDENFILAQNISVGGPNEIVFTKLSATTTSAVFTVTLGQDLETLSVSAMGIVSR